MRIEDIRPFVRFARYLTLDEKSSYPTWIPLDARLFYTVSGNGEISVGKISFSMSHGVCLILPSGTEYRLETPTKSVTYLALNFDFNADLGSTVTVPVHPVAKSEFSDSLLTDRTEIDGTDVFSSPLCIENLLLENELIEIEREYTREYEYRRTVTGNILHNILLRCARRRTLRPGEVRLDIERILDYVGENCTRDISNAALAERFGFNPNYISDAVKKYTGMPLHAYLVRMRIMKSLALLESGNLTVSEIASLCGFSDPAYFSRRFKKEMGVLPTEYVKNGRQSQ